MSNLVLKLSSKDTDINTRSLLANGSKVNLDDFLSKIGEMTSPSCEAQLLNNDASYASASITMNHSSETDGDTIQIGSMVLTAKNALSSNPLAPNLLTAASFAVLASSTITNTGSSVVTGDLGLYAGTSVTGFPPGTVIGVQHITDSAAHQAEIDAMAAYTDLASRSVTTNYSGTDLGTLTLAPGVYKFNTSAQLTGTLTLDAGGNANAVWIFQIGSTLTTASASAVSIINGGSAGNVYWQVGSSATLGTTTSFQGTILALASVTCTTSASIQGRAIALTAAVTLDTNAITKVLGTLGGGVIVLSGNQFFIGASDAASAVNLAAAINQFSLGLLTALSVGAVVTVSAAYTGLMGNAVPILIAQASAGGMVASGLALIGGLRDSAPSIYYRNFK